MGLFDFLKKEKKKEFPKFPKMPEFPKYESPLKSLKEVTKPEFPIPIRKPVFKLPPVREPIRQEPVTAPPAPVAKEPVYVKLSKYKTAVKLINEINLKLQESERILAQLTEIKSKETIEIEKWRAELDSIKNKLMEVDKNLFEA